MEERNVVPQLTVVGGKLVATSLNIAEVFGKRHADVVRAIQGIDVPKDFTERNFALSEYKDSTGRSLPMYNLTRDGFTLLVMGFTGKEAMKFKLAYIEMFNKLEKKLWELTHPTPPPAPPQGAITSQLQDAKGIAEFFGVTGNQALISANTFVRKTTGIDPMALIEVQLVSEVQQKLVTPTELGSYFFGGASGKKVNRALLAAGLQYNQDTSWRATAEGQKFSRYLDTGKKHSNGTMIQQLKWYETVAEVIRPFMQ